ncbi:Rieske (2Fe-2S) protein [Achromobacter denitrificans]|uniref:Rieske 2Fe-2S domain-containing protein n=1 Tax=Achromobacter denitrificans TaxID=32002 RepID=A0ABZ3GCX8_ACHDE|nr:Rieske 2Fe-2S domain-containing protein [Achromobacter denitrificans]MDX3882001.1 Rieske 2Fe-2S domain-containing protein [Achromobacter sp.]ASC66895.1 4-nitrocatechol monooxygenase [Achromobacter denitrificans]MBV2158051.1 Rieske 2Fe-2S domain-containing protein [Achromobacter denitrificans]MDF3850340.1 Rieske 2Fe-2S domain-containing protein [Achromobacter denitrificans]MDF3940571.1 Rieske 2Fe-2S domain-containing protein [Achromobacter denitrificans]
MTSCCPGREAEAALCRVEDIPDGGSLTAAVAARPVILLRRGDAVWGYLNRCPHFSVTLNAARGTVLTYEGQVLMCAHHSALFRFEDGLCIEGPCQGAALDALPLRVEEGCVYAGDPQAR